MSLIILDRDGVINHDSEHYIKSPDEWRPIDGSLDAIAQLNRHGYRVVVATNQSGVARGLYDVAMLDAIHEKMQQMLAEVGGCVEEIFFCPHHPNDKCFCRKPQPGLLKKIEEKYQPDMTEIYFVGDNYTDVQAAKAAGCQPLLVLTGKGQASLNQYPELAELPYFADLAEVVEFVLREDKT